MKTSYIQPITTAMRVQNGTLICASVRTNVEMNIGTGESTQAALLPNRVLV